MPLRHRILVLILLFINFNLFAQWSKKNLSSNKIFEKVLFTDSLHCFLAGQDAQFYSSNDAGESWNLRPYQHMTRIYDLFFYDSLHGFLCGENGAIAETKDAGQTWIKRNLSTIEFNRGIYFYQNHGIVVADQGRVFSSSDSGKTWTINQLPFPRGLKDVVILSNGTCLAVGDTGFILKKNTADTVWTLVSGPTNLTLRSMHFFNDSIGFAGGGQFSGSGYKNVLLYTTDGGQSWSPRTLNFSKQINSVYFLNKDTGFLACSDGFLMRSIDGGFTWYRIFPHLLYLNSIAFSGKVGLLAGDGGSLYKNSNFGGYILSVNSQKKQFSVYPNPAKNEVQLHVNGESYNGWAELIDISGRVLCRVEVMDGLLQLPEGIEKGYYTLLINSRSLANTAAAKLIID